MNKGKLQTNGSERIKSVIECSKEYDDGIELSEMLSNGGNLKIKNHKSCTSSNTSLSHLNPSKRKLEKGSSTLEPSKKVRRSKTATFDFRHNCLFCCDTCNVKKESKHPNRRRKAYR